MNFFRANFLLLLVVISCSNSPELETGEIKTFKLLKQAFEQSNKPNLFVDARTLLTRNQIDNFNIPILFVELPSGQNGTLTKYPGQGIGQTWLGADGATITLEKGILKASRGMGDDIMGSSSSMPPWSTISQKSKRYDRKLTYMTGNNGILQKKFACKIKNNKKKIIIEIWDAKFTVTKFKETCDYNGFEIINTYYVDDLGVVRKSKQYHSDTIGHIVIERLDR